MSEIKHLHIWNERNKLVSQKLYDSNYVVVGAITLLYICATYG